MKYTQINPDGFQKLVLNAGVLLKGADFNPATGTYDKNNILGITSGGLSFNANPSYEDFGSDMDNVPPNTKQLKRITSYDPAISGTLISVDAASTKMLNGGADIDSSDATHVVPRTALATADFADLWLVGDYSDVNTGANAGFFAILLKNALNTGGFQLQTTKDGKGQFSFDFHGHYDLEDIDNVPFEVYVSAGTSSTTVVTLSALTIADTTLAPAFSAATTRYTASTTDATNVVSATATDTTNAAVAILVNGASLTSGTAATWKSGTNAVIVTVTNGDASKRYSITVTKS